MYNLLPCVVSPCLTNARISSFVWFLDSICSSIRRRRWIAREGASTRRWAHTLPPCVASNTEGCTIERFSFYFFDRMRSRIWWWRWTAREGRSTRGGSKHEQSKHTEVIDCWYQVPPPPHFLHFHTVLVLLIFGLRGSPRWYLGFVMVAFVGSLWFSVPICMRISDPCIVCRHFCWDCCNFMS
jgi:hypothetical protein